MTVAKALCWSAIALAVACGRRTTEPQANDAMVVSGSPEASISLDTEITGTFGGAPVTLRNAAGKRAVAGDPRNWICVANVPVSLADCMTTNGQSRTMLLGAFAYDAMGMPKWSLIETGLYRVGANPLTAIARSGTVEVVTDDPATGRLDLRVMIDFGSSQTVSGTVSLIP